MNRLLAWSQWFNEKIDLFGTNAITFNCQTDFGWISFVKILKKLQKYDMLFPLLKTIISVLKWKFCFIDKKNS